MRTSTSDRRRERQPTGGSRAWRYVLTGLSGALAGAAPLCAQTPGAPTTSASVTVDTGRVIGDLPRDFLGLSFEKAVLANNSLDPSSGNLVRLLRNLSTHGHFRFGGTLLDTETWWQPGGRPRPLWARFEVDRAHFDRFAELARRTGWSVEMATNLQNFDVDSTTDEAAYAAKALGPVLLGVACGNEPDLFPGMKAWQDQRVSWSRCADAVAPFAKLNGGEDAEGLRPAMLADVGKRLTLATSHFYAEYANFPGPEGRQRYAIADLLSRATVDRTVRRLSGEVSLARRYGLAYRVSESNSAACLRQDNSGAVYAAALWSVDYQLLAASHGVSGVNFHIPWESWRLCDDRATYSALCVRDYAGRDTNTLIANTLYYGLLAFADVHAGKLLQADVAGGGNMTAYAVRSANADQVIVVQKDAPGGTPIAVSIRGLANSRVATTKRLQAPTFASGQAAIRFAGAQVAADGTFTPRVVGRVVPRTGGYTLVVPTGTATIVTIPRL